MRTYLPTLISLSFFCLVFFDLSPAQAAVPKQKVILSFFEGFAGSDGNQSQVIADLVKAKLASDASIELIMCQGSEDEGLRVAFSSTRTDVRLANKLGSLELGDTAFQQLSHCYDLNPDAREIISLAEGNCELNVAGVAYNAMETGKKKQLADNNGNRIPSPQKIELDGPDFIFTDDLNIQTTCSLPDPKMLEYSTDVGDYVCNNLLYNFQKKIVSQHLPVNYSMIHVPTDFGNFKKRCDKKAFKQAVGSSGEKLNAESMNELVASEVTSFIEAKHKLMIAHPDHSLQTCSEQLKALRSGSQGIYESHYQEKN
jgi:hypothetical protein